MAGDPERARDEFDKIHTHHSEAAAEQILAAVQRNRHTLIGPRRRHVRRRVPPSRHCTSTRAGPGHPPPGAELSRRGPRPPVAAARAAGASRPGRKRSTAARRRRVPPGRTECGVLQGLRIADAVELDDGRRPLRDRRAVGPVRRHGRVPRQPRPAVIIDEHDPRSRARPARGRPAGGSPPPLRERRCRGPRAWRRTFRRASARVHRRVGCGSWRAEEKRPAESRTMRLEITRRTDLATRAMLELERLGRRAESAELAELIGTTPGFLSQALTPAVGAGWVRSDPGPAVATRSWPTSTTSACSRSSRRSRGPPTSAGCVLEDRTCSGGGPCALHQPWSRARSLLTEQLATSTLGPLGAGSWSAGCGAVRPGSGPRPPGAVRGLGNCHRWAPEVYPLDADGQIDLHLLRRSRPSSPRPRRVGAQVCPARAITVIGERPLPAQGLGA